MTDRPTRSEIVEETDGVRDGDGTHRIDGQAAADAYLDDPERFHATTPDNPEGDPVTNLVLQDGPWWVSAEDQANQIGL